MMHSDTRTFLKHYLSRRIETDVQSIYRGLEPQTEIMRAATRMGRWIDTRRPRELTTEQKASVEQSPEVKDLIQRRDRWKRLPLARCQGTEEYYKLQKSKQEVINARKRRTYALLKEIRESFDDNQAVIDIEQQLSGGAIDEGVKERPATEEGMLPEQIHLLEKLTTWPTSLQIEDEWHRRSEAIKAVTVYCRVEEGGSQRGRKPQRLEQDVSQPSNSSGHEEAQSASLLDATLKHLRQEKRPLICFLCFGNRKLSIGRRIKKYNRPQDLTRHFREDHLKRLEEDEFLHCGLCNEKLKHKMHLRNHARTAHRTHS